MQEMPGYVMEDPHGINIVTEKDPSTGMHSSRAQGIDLPPTSHKSGAVSGQLMLQRVRSWIQSGMTKKDG